MLPINALYAATGTRVSSSASRRRRRRARFRAALQPAPCHDERSNAKRLHAGRPRQARPRRVRPPRGCATHPRRERLRARLRRPGQAAARRAHEPRGRTPPASATCATAPGRRSTTTSRAISTRSRSPSGWPNGYIRLVVGIADVDALVSKGTPLDEHAYANCTSVYTGVDVFPMLPEKLSTGPHVAERGRRPSGDRDRDGRERRTATSCRTTSTARWCATRRKLAYDAGRRVARRRRRRRRRSPTTDADRPAQAPGRGVAAAQGRACCGTARSSSRRSKRRRSRKDGRDRRPQGHRTRTAARDLIEDFMIASNVAIAKFLEAQRTLGNPSRRARAGALGAHRRAGGALRRDAARPTPDSLALAHFLADRRKADPERFPGSVARRS